MVPHTRTLKVDLDHCDRRKWRSWVKREAWLLEQARSILGVRVSSVAMYRTRKGFHLVARVDGLKNDRELVALQAMLGSDAIREMLNLYRVRSAWAVWNVMFVRKRERGPGRRRRKSRERFDRSATAMLRRRLLTPKAPARASVGTASTTGRRGRRRPSCS